MAAVFAALGTLFFVIGAHTFYRNCQFAGNVDRVAQAEILIDHLDALRPRVGGSGEADLPPLQQDAAGILDVGAG